MALRRPRVAFAWPAAAGWVNTGHQVSQGQTLLFNTTGEVRLSTAGDDVAGPAGSKKGRYAANAPIPSALAVRSSAGSANGVPFAIGNQTSSPSPGTGTLWLAVNDDVSGRQRRRVRRRDHGAGDAPVVTQTGELPSWLPLPSAARPRRTPARAKRASPLKCQSRSSMPDWKATLNLPRTEFPMKANLQTAEPETIAEWEKTGLYRQLRERRAGAPKYVLHDGPPYANGQIHLGTALNKILKDLVVKARSMAGYDAPYIPGYDCHGLPIELKVDRELGPKKRQHVAGGLSPRLPRLRRAVHRRDDRGVPAARACSATGSSRT